MDIKELLLEAAEFCKARDGLLLSVRLTAAAEKCDEQVSLTAHGHSAPAYSCNKPGDHSGTYYLAPQPAQPDSPPTLQSETIAMLNKLLPGLPVSVDVSTGDADFGNRIFATIAEVQDDAQGGLIVLATDAVANYAAPQPAQVPECMKILTEIVEDYGKWVKAPMAADDNVAELMERARAMLAATPQPAPDNGRWYQADDIDLLVKEMDTLLNGTHVAEQPLLCDLVAQMKKQGVVLGQPSTDTAFIDAHEAYRRGRADQLEAMQKEPASNTVQPVQVPEWRFSANEWADTACNALQYLKNERDGMGDIDTAIDAITDQIEHCRAAAPQAEGGVK